MLRLSCGIVGGVSQRKLDPAPVGTNIAIGMVRVRESYVVAVAIKVWVNGIPDKTITRNVSDRIRIPKGTYH